MANDSPQTKAPSCGRPRSGRRCSLQQDGPPHEGNNTKQRTGRYNMHVLKEISRTEELALKDLAVMFQVENDDSLPVSFDLPQLLDLKEGERRPFLNGMLQCCPSDMVPVFIDKYLNHINGLGPYVS